jgi:hypothetical protein
MIERYSLLFGYDRYDFSKISRHIGRGNYLYHMGEPMYQSLSIQILLFMSTYVLVVFVLSSEGYNETILYVVKRGYYGILWVNLLFYKGNVFH